jgi:hypothetical protein
MHNPQFLNASSALTQQVQKNLRKIAIATGGKGPLRFFPWPEDFTSGAV